MKRKLSKIYTYIKLFLIILLLFSSHNTESSEISELIATKEKPPYILDGDSLNIDNNRIRLIGIDAPEYDQYCKNKNNQNYPCGKEAKKHLINLIKDKNVICKIHKKDQYERFLCTCYADNIDINKAMISSGNAIVYLESPYKKEEEEAKKHKRGIWKGTFMRPRLFRIWKEKNTSR